MKKVELAPYIQISPGKKSILNRQKRKMEMQKTDCRRNSVINMEGKKVKKRKMAVIAAAITILPSIGMSVTGTVKVGDFDNQSATPLIGDFAEEITATIATLNAGAKALEDVSNGFDDCSSKLGRDPLDKAMYTECVIEKSQITRDAYRQAKVDFENLDRRLEEYQYKTNKAVSQSKQELATEEQNMAEVQKTIAEYERQANELIQKIDGTADDQELTDQQSALIYEVTDGLMYHNNKSEMLKGAISILKADLLSLENGNEAISQLQESIKRVNRNFDYRIDEANLFIRLGRNYSLTKARLMETGAIVDVFHGFKDQMNKILNHRPGYATAMHQLGGGSGGTLIRSNEPPTAGEALALLKSLVKKGD